MASFREDSKREWTSDSTTEKINAGSLQRIADATEKMAANWAALAAERDRYKRWYEEECERRRRIEKRTSGQIAAFRGAITKMKKLVSHA